MKYILFYLLLTLSIFSCKEASKNTSNTIKKQNAIPKKIDVFPNEKNQTGILYTKVNGCGYSNQGKYEGLKIFKPKIKEIQQIQEILKYSGLPINFEIYSANINNALATIINGKRYILYDEKLLNYSDKMSGEYWTSMSILAHEIGHHLSGHTLSNTGSSHSIELEADKYSGFILHKMGASKEQSIKAINLFISNSASNTHPSKSKRIKAIIDGWEESNQTRYNSAIPPASNDNIDVSNYIFTTEKILGDPNQSYQKLRDKNGYGSWVSGFYEGIIIENEENDCIIHITKIPKDDDYISKDSRISITLYDHLLDMDRVTTQSLYYSLQPGRKIIFAFGEEGTAPSRYFAYVKLVK